MTNPQSPHFKALLDTPRGLYVYESRRGRITFPGGFAMPCRAHHWWVYVTSTIAYLKEKGRAYNYSVESDDEGSS